MRTSHLFARLTASAIVGPGLLSGLAVVVGMLVSFAGQMLISRHLGVAAYGEYVLLVGWSMLLVLPASLGVDGPIIRFMPGYLGRGETRRYRWLILVAVTIQLTAILLILALLYLMRLAGVPAMSWIDSYSLALVGCLIAATVVGNTALAVLQAAKRVVIAQILNQVVRPLLLLVGIGALIYGVGGGYSAIDLFAVTALSVLAATILLAVHIAARFLLVPSQGNPSLEVRAWLSFAGGNLAGGIGQQALLQLPLLLVGNLSNEFEAGHYGVASRLAGIVMLGLSSLTAVSMPLFATAFEDGDSHAIQRMASVNARLSFSFALAAALGLIVFGPAILSLFGSGFNDAQPVLVFLSLGLLAASAFGPAVGMVAMSGRPSVIAISNAAGVVLIVIVAWLTVPRFGAMGGAAAYVVGTLTALIGASAYARLRLGQNTTIFRRIGKADALPVSSRP